MSERDVYSKRKTHELMPAFRIVDTAESEIKEQTPYFYSTFGKENETEETEKQSVLVLGSGPI